MTIRLTIWDWLGLAVALAAFAALLLIAPHPAFSAPGCMTMQEARGKFPAKHLWWHTRSHCWDDQPGVGSRKAKWLPRPSLDASGNIAHHSGRPLMVEPPQPAMSEAQIDELQYRQEAESRLEICCWPPPEALAEISFAERWAAVPSDWRLILAAAP